MNTPTTKYIIKIDDDNKFVQFNGTTVELKNIITRYYKSNEVKFVSLPNKTDLTFLKSLTQPNSFFSNNDFELEEFIEKINLYNMSVEYFNNKFNLKNNVEVKKPEPILLINFHSRSEENTSELIKKHNEPEQRSGLFGYNEIERCSELIKKHHKPEQSSILFGYDEIPGYSEDKVNEPMNINDFDESVLSYKKSYNIYYNNQFNNICVIEPSEDLLFNYMNQLLPELILLFSNCKINMNQFEQFTKVSKEIFVNAEDAKMKINKMINDKVIDSKLSIEEMKDLISKYFTINTNPENRVKFTNIWEIISSEIKVSEPYVSYLKRQLPMILEDLNLMKKRYSDGIYWYGLVKKNELKYTISDNKEIKESGPIDENTFTTYLKEREVEITPNNLPPDEYLLKLIKSA